MRKMRGNISKKHMISILICAIFTIVLTLTNFAGLYPTEGYAFVNAPADGTEYNITVGQTQTIELEGQWPYAFASLEVATDNANATASVSDYTVDFMSLKSQLTVTGVSAGDCIVTVTEHHRATGASPVIDSIVSYTFHVSGGNNGNPNLPNQVKKENTVSKTNDHTHSYSWVVTKSPTATEDGEEAYMCTCGAVAQTRTLSSFSTFEDEIVGQIKNAPANGVVTIDMKTWNSLGKAVRDALVARPDVTLKLSFRSEGYKGQRLKVTIPTGIDRYALWDENGWLGLCRLGSTLGYDQ